MLHIYNSKTQVFVQTEDGKAYEWMPCIAFKLKASTIINDRAPNAEVTIVARFDEYSTDVMNTLKRGSELFVGYVERGTRVSISNNQMLICLRHVGKVTMDMDNVVASNPQDQDYVNVTWKFGCEAIFSKLSRDEDGHLVSTFPS